MLTRNIFKQHNIGFESYASGLVTDGSELVYTEGDLGEVEFDEVDDVTAGIAMAFEELDRFTEVKKLLTDAGPQNTQVVKMANVYISRSKRWVVNSHIPPGRLKVATEEFGDRAYSVALESIGEIIKAIVDSIKETFTSLWDWISSFFDSEGRSKAGGKADEAVSAAESALTGEPPRNAPSNTPPPEHQRIVAYAELSEERKKQAVELLSTHLEHFKFLLPKPTVGDLIQHIQTCTKRVKAMTEIADHLLGLEERLVKATSEEIKDIVEKKRTIADMEKGHEASNKEVDQIVKTSGRPIKSKKIKDELAGRGTSAEGGDLTFVADARSIFDATDSNQIVMYASPAPTARHPKFIRIEAFKLEEAAVTDQAAIALESTKEEVLKYTSELWSYKDANAVFEKRLKGIQEKSKKARDTILANFEKLAAVAKQAGPEKERDETLRALSLHLRYGCHMSGKQAGDLVKAANLTSATYIHHAAMSRVIVRAFGMPIGKPPKDDPSSGNNAEPAKNGNGAPSN